MQNSFEIDIYHCHLSVVSLHQRSDLLCVILFESKISLFIPAATFDATEYNLKFNTENTLHSATNKSTHKIVLIHTNRVKVNARIYAIIKCSSFVSLETGAFQKLQSDTNTKHVKNIS